MWQQTTKDDPEWTELSWGSGGLAVAYGRENLVIEGDIAIYRSTRPVTRRVPELQELEALLAKWRADGKGHLADAVDWDTRAFEEDTGEIRVAETRIDLNDPAVKFIKYDRPGGMLGQGGGTILWTPLARDVLKDW